MRKLASIQMITNMKDVPGTDTLAVATIGPWNTLVKKNEMLEGDLVVYFEIDSICPDTADFEFMRHLKHRVKAIKLRGICSQGLAMPLYILPDKTYRENDDVTALLGVTRYSKPCPARLEGVVKDKRPPFVPRTNETNLLHRPQILDEMYNKEAYISTKLDGTSMSVYSTPSYKTNTMSTIGVCNRNYELKPTGKDTYWKVARRLDLVEKMQVNRADKIVIQGELCGPGIQSNPLGLKEVNWYVFNVWINGTLQGLNSMVIFCEKLGLNTVPIEDIIVVDHSLDWFKERAREDNKEGIVIRVASPVCSPQLHFRPLSARINNPDYKKK